MPPGPTCFQPVRSLPLKSCFHSPDWATTGTVTRATRRMKAAVRTMFTSAYAGFESRLCGRPSIIVSSRKWMATLSCEAERLLSGEVLVAFDYGGCCGCDGRARERCPSSTRQVPEDEIARDASKSKQQNSPEPFAED